jgi:hypothetical protein
MNDLTAHVSPHRGGVRLSVWCGKVEDAPFLCTSIHLTPALAEKLVNDLRATLDNLPRIGTAADLGCEVL